MAEPRTHDNGRADRGINGKEHEPHCPGRAPRPAQLQCQRRSVGATTFHGQASSHEEGRLGHTEFSTVSAVVGSGGGPPVALRGTRPPPGESPTPAFGAQQPGPPVKGAFSRSKSHHPCEIGRRSIPLGVVSGADRRARARGGRARPRGGDPPQPTARDAHGRTGRPADLRPSGRLQVF